MEIVFGIHPVLECLRARTREVERLIIAKGAANKAIQEIIDLGRHHHVPIKFESRIVLDRQAGGGIHQGVLAVCAVRPTIDLEDLLSGLGPLPLVVVLDSIEDPRNLGAILRTCAAAGADGVIIPKDHAAGLSPTVAKTAAGALDLLKISRVTNLVSAIKALKDKGLWVAGVETDQSLPYAQLDGNIPLAVVFGNEDSGLRRLVRETCDFLVSIPTQGPMRSLNVSVASGIVLFELVRQRNATSASGSKV
jgi:23S rRNA (guanosine2251-2'-O)-methyltransferase